MTKADLAAAVKDAATAAVEEAAALAAKEEGTAAEAEATPKVEEQTPPPPVEVGNEVKPEVPTELFGVDLSVLPDDEARQKFIDEFTETNKTIGKLQRELAETKKVVAEVPPTPPVQPASEEPVFDASSLTDDQIAEALGMDLENSTDPDRDSREIGLARKFLEQEQRLERLEASNVESTTDRVWTKALDELEGRFGVLTVSRPELLAFAAKEGIASPEAAYWTAVGPVRATVAKALESRLIELKTDAKKQASSPRPKTSVEVDETRLKATNVKDAIAEAFEKARADLGVELSEA